MIKVSQIHESRKQIHMGAQTKENLEKIYNSQCETNSEYMPQCFGASKHKSLNKFPNHSLIFSW